MPTREAEEYLESLGVVGKDLEELRPLIGRSLFKILPDPNLDNFIANEAVTQRASGVSNIPRRMLITTLWLLGGSNNKIARLLRVTNQTVFAHVDKALPPGNARHALRLNSALSNEALEWYFNIWLKYADELGSMAAPEQMAQWLLAHHPYQE